MLTAAATLRALAAVADERARQEEELTDPTVEVGVKLAVLIEAVGAVGRVIVRHADPQLVGSIGAEVLCDRLVEVAAVAVAWSEALDRGEPA